MNEMSTLSDEMEGVSKPAPPSAVILFGAGGDLAKRKLMPAFAHLRERGLLSDTFAFIGVARQPMTTAAFAEKVSHDVATFGSAKLDPSHGAWLSDRAEYVSGDFGDAALYVRLAKLLAEVDRKRGTAGCYLFYLATPPTFFAEIVRQLGAAGLLVQKEARWRRVVIEKPFGRDLESALTLNRDVLTIVDESQLYRIDHYLGKETVQNLIALRFANGIFEPVWNRNFIDHVQITVAETLGVELRAGYYDNAGALRDMLPNHLFQLLALTAMEPPASFSATAVRNEMCETIEAIAPLAVEDVPRSVIRGQYAAGQTEQGLSRAYRDEPDVAPGSTTETFVALRVEVDNWRWASVPFYLRTGKRLARRVSEIAIQFRRAPATLFRRQPNKVLAPNGLIIRLQPDEGMSLHIQARVPGPLVRLGNVQLDFSYAQSFGQSPTTGYETLLYDALCGEATLFQRADMVEAGWRVVSPIQKYWTQQPQEIASYEAGGWGPDAANDLLARDGRAWRTPQ